METVVDPEADRLQRVMKPVGNMCAWCIGIAAASAEGEPPDRPHADCDCVMVLVRIDWPQPVWLRDLLLILVVARLAAGKDDPDEREIAYHIRREFPDMVTDGVHPREPAGGGGGGGQPPREPPTAGASDEPPRPEASYGAAQHSIDRHAYDAPNENGVSYFPRGFFGEFDDDIEFAR